MILTIADWFFIGLYSVLVLSMGVYFARTRVHSADDLLIAGRKLPWWVIGFSNVASYSGGGGVWVFIFFVGVFDL